MPHYIFKDKVIYKELLEIIEKFKITKSITFNSFKAKTEILYNSITISIDKK